MSWRLLLGILVLAVVIPLVVSKHRERMRDAAFAGQFEYDYSWVQVDPPPRRVLTVRPDGRWTMVTTFPRFDGQGTQVGADSGSYRIAKATLQLRSERHRVPAIFTIAGDTLYARTAWLNAALERNFGRPMPVREEVLVRTSHLH